MTEVEELKATLAAERKEAERAEAMWNERLTAALHANRQLEDSVREANNRYGDARYQLVEARRQVSQLSEALFWEKAKLEITQKQLVKLATDHEAPQWEPSK